MAGVFSLKFATIEFEARKSIHCSLSFSEMLALLFEHLFYIKSSLNFNL